jgi:hypothetical protein
MGAVSMVGIGLGAAVAAGGIMAIRWSIRPTGPDSLTDDRARASRAADTGCAGVVLLLFGVVFAVIAVASDLG